MDKTAHASGPAAKSPRTSAPPRLLVLETSALISILNQFTDPHTHSIEALEKLTQPPPGKAEPLTDGLYIPDQVFYEFSGILPFNIPRMIERLLHEKDNPQGLKKVIEFYVSVSPRTAVGVRHADMNRDQLYTLLSYVAKYPQCLGYNPQTGTMMHTTQTAEHYVGRLRAEHAVLGGVGMMLPKNYRPTIGNVMDALGNAFNTNALRIHAGQLYMMGFYTEDEFKQRMEKEHGIDEKPRFIKIIDFVNHLHTNKKWITESMRDKIIRKRDETVAMALRHTRTALKNSSAERYEKDRILEETKQNHAYLTVGFLKNFPHLLELYRAEGNKTIAMKEKGNIGQFARKDALVDLSIRPSRMLIEHYVYGGIFPIEALPEIAQMLGFDMNHGQPGNDPRSLIHHLDKQGFFERSLNTEELIAIHTKLQQNCASGYCPYQTQLDTLTLLIDALPRAVLRCRDEFDKACANPLPFASMQSERTAIHEVGVPYEKVFSEELINGTISFTQFFEIAQKSGCLVRAGRSDAQLVATPSNDIIIAYDPANEGKNSRIWIRQSDQDVHNTHKHSASFVSRSGLAYLRRHYAGAGATLPFSDALYWQFSAGELIERARANRGYNGEKDPLDRCFSSILYRGATQSASQMRRIACELIDEPTLLQMEKDFSTRHARSWLRHLPAYTNPMAALHVARRIARKNMGELATAEVAIQLAQQHPQARITIVNHDSDLFPDSQGIVHMSDDIRQMHSGRHSTLTKTSTQLTALSSEGRIDFLRTDQLLDTLCLLLGHQKPHMPETQRKREPYPGVRMKESMSAHTNHDWQARIHEPLQQRTVRR